MERKIDWSIGALCRSVVVAEPKGKAPDSMVDLRSYPYLWSRALGSDRKNEIAGKSS